MITTHTHTSLDILAPGVLFHQYKLLERIGVGGQGVVWSALDQNKNRICAIKFNEVPGTDEAEADLIRDEHQLEELVKLRHTHILPLHEYGFDQQLRFTVSPYVPGGTLTEKIKTSTLSSGEILRIGSEIASALDYLHSQGIIHRDLKSSNILLGLDLKVYLADFGLARLVTTSTLAFHTGHGTPPYAPPEQIQLKAITPKSDIFSFGILLYELFTGQLPWNGKKQLGMEQSHSKQELPDPREFNNELPPFLVDVLRRVTSADSQMRPRSAGETMKMLYYIFKTAPEPQSARSIHDELTGNGRAAEVLLNHGLEQWHSTNGTYNLGLTKFAMIDLERSNIDLKIFRNFMLSQALTYGYNNDEWWELVDNPRQRLAVCADMLQKKNEIITARIIEHLKNDPDIHLFPDEMLEDMVTSLLEIGTNSDNLLLRQQIFEGIRSLTHPGSEWKDTFDADQMKRLGIHALEDSEAGDMAAELIGHLRSPSAVQVIMAHPDEERKYGTLLLIQQSSGYLPLFVTGSLRFRLSIDWIIQRLVQQPVNLIGAYMMAFLGAALGVGLQNYLTINITDLFDNVRITLSLERGLIIGSIFGLGIFIPRVIMELFKASNVFMRIILGTLLGGVAMNIALLIFHVLFLTTPPQGFLITAGSILIAMAFSLGGLFRSRVIRMVLASASVFIAIMGTWIIHVNSAASSLELTPMFRYDYSWSPAQVSLTVLGVALFMGIPGNIVALSIRKE